MGTIPSMPGFGFSGPTGEPGWVDEQARPVPLTEVGPVAWSEGARMAARIYAGRKTEEAWAGP